MKTGLYSTEICYIFACMNKTTFVVFLLLSNKLFASALSPEINNIESQWADIYYAKNQQQQKNLFPKLIKNTAELTKRFPKAAEPIIWHAIAISTNAAFEQPFKALESIETAKKLLESAIKKDPRALDGAAQVTLGTLYYMTPGWPISFGSNDKAEHLLKQALSINPNSIDSNYFYADYLLSKDKVKEAQNYFKKAINAPVRKHQRYADEQLQHEALLALKRTEQRKLESGKNRFWSLISNAKND